MLTREFTVQVVQIELKVAIAALEGYAKRNSQPGIPGNSLWSISSKSYKVGSNDGFRNTFWPNLSAINMTKYLTITAIGNWPSCYFSQSKIILYCSLKCRVLDSKLNHNKISERSYSWDMWKYSGGTDPSKTHTFSRIFKWRNMKESVNFIRNVLIFLFYG